MVSLTVVIVAAGAAVAGYGIYRGVKEYMFRKKLATINCSKDFLPKETQQIIRLYGISEDLVFLHHEAGSINSGRENLYKYGLPAVRPIINSSQDFKNVIKGLIIISKMAKYEQGDIYKLGLPTLRKMFKTPKEFKENWNFLIEIVEKAGQSSNSYSHTHYRPFTRFLISLKNLKSLAKI